MDPLNILVPLTIAIVASVIAAIIAPYCISTIQQLFSVIVPKPSRGNLEQIEDKLSKLQPSASIVLVGSIYLDILVKGVPTKKLDKVEFRLNDSIPFLLGGSGIFVGQYLFKEYKKKSVLRKRKK